MQLRFPTLACLHLPAAGLAVAAVPRAGKPDGNTFSGAAAGKQAHHYKEAFRLWRQLALEGDTRARFNVALMYETGVGVQADQTKSAKWLRDAATQGLAQAQASLAMKYAFGKGVPQSDREAVASLQRGAADGFEPGRELLEEIARQHGR